MIDRTHDLPLTRQCRILDLARSTAYYTPMPTSAEDLALMRRMDGLHLEDPFVRVAGCCATCCARRVIWSTANGCAG